jgi:DNA polymerase-3 subunit beta
MMKVSCLQENLAKGLNIVGRAVASRSTTLPVLSNVLLSTDNGRLKLSATNLEIGINTWIGAKVEMDGAITIPARTFVDLVNTLPPERIDMELSVRTQTLHLSCGRSEANIKGIDAQEFPLIPSPEGVGQILIDPEILNKMINQVAFAAATDESRPMLTGVLTKFDQHHLTMAAADGFRLSVRKALLNTPVSESIQVLIPAKALTELARISGEQKDPIEITITPARNQILFHLTHTDLVAQLVDLQFPDYEQIIPKRHTTRTVVNAPELLKAGRAANIFAREAANTARLHVLPGEELTPGRVSITARSDETGDNVGEIDAAVDGEEIEIAFNIRYLLDVLSVIDAPQVALETSTSNSPGVIKPVGDDDFIHVIMPMHIGR